LTTLTDLLGFKVPSPRYELGAVVWIFANIPSVPGLGNPFTVEAFEATVRTINYTADFSSDLPVVCAQYDLQVNRIPLEVSRSEDEVYPSEAAALSDEGNAAFKNIVRAVIREASVIAISKSHINRLLRTPVPKSIY